MANTRVKKLETAKTTSKDAKSESEARESQAPAAPIEREGTYHFTSLTSHIRTNNNLEQPRRPCGRPKKAMAVESQATEEAGAAKVVSHKHGRKNNVSASDDEIEQAKKRTKPASKAENEPPLPQKARKMVAVPSQDELPDCIGRNVNSVPKSTAQCSSQEVQAEKEAKKRDIERQIQELQEAKRLLAVTNVSEEARQNYPTRLSAALRKRTSGDRESDGEGHESFNFQEADDMPTSSSDEGSARQEVSLSLLA